MNEPSISRADSHPGRMAVPILWSNLATKPAASYQVSQRGRLRRSVESDYSLPELRSQSTPRNRQGQRSDLGPGIYDIDSRTSTECNRLQVGACLGMALSEEEIIMAGVAERVDAIFGIILLKVSERDRLSSVKCLRVSARNNRHYVACEGDIEMRHHAGFDSPPPA